MRRMSLASPNVTRVAQESIALTPYPSLPEPLSTINPSAPHRATSSTFLKTTLAFPSLSSPEKQRQQPLQLYVIVIDVIGKGIGDPLLHPATYHIYAWILGSSYQDLQLTSLFPSSVADAIGPLAVPMAVAIGGPAVTYNWPTDKSPTGSNGVTLQSPAEALFRTNHAEQAIENINQQIPTSLPPHRLQLKAEVAVMQHVADCQDDGQPFGWLFL
uniref:Uncharacterized protein n=1 Tax=Steinernema glaseri TaxID=37863 RepID=A0A1I7Z5H3_9BILA